MSDDAIGDRTLIRETKAATTELRLQLVEKAAAEHEKRLDDLEREVGQKLAYVYGIIAAVTTVGGLILWVIERVP